MRTINSELKKILSDPKKRRSWVLYQIHKQGRSLAEIGRESGVVSRSIMYAAFRKPYPKIEKILAQAVDVTPQQLFPERYGTDGLPNRRMGRYKNNISKRLNKNKNNCNVNKAKAA
jgi:Ner family transcriptional regulator